MNLIDYIKEENILIHDSIKDKDSLLKKIAQTLINNPLLAGMSESEIYQKLIERENITSTGFGNKIAIPHIVLDNLDDFVMGIITIQNGIDFDSIDDKRVHLFFYIIAPKSKRKSHIRFLAQISNVFRDEDKVQKTTDYSNTKKFISYPF